MFRIFGADVYIDRRFIKKDIIISGRTIHALVEPGAHPGIPGFDAGGMQIIPGFIDVHSHGGGGEDFNLCSGDGLLRLLQFYASHGVSSILATVLTDTDDVITRQLRLLAEARKNGAMQIEGIHLEGPFLSRDYRGAMPEELLRDPDLALFEKWQEAAQGLIKLITISPELKGAAEFTKQVSSGGCVVSLGHSGASFSEAMACIENGARGITHTMNGMKLIHQHDPGILCAAFLSDVYCEIICDGRHLYPEIVQLLLKVKGRDRLIGITDSIMAAGLPDGEYKLGVNDIVVRDGDAKLKGGNNSRAGSTLSMEQGLERYMRYTGQSLAEALPVYTENPADYIRISRERGRLEAGKSADFALLSGGGPQPLVIFETVASGKALLGRIRM